MNKTLHNRIKGDVDTKPEERKRLLKFGKDLGRAIEELIAIVSPSTFYRCGRTIGVLILDSRNINREMVAEGWAFQYTKYDKTEELRKAEESACERELGLWADQMPVPPWEFRKKK